MTDTPTTPKTLPATDQEPESDLLPGKTLPTETGEPPTETGLAPSEDPDSSVTLEEAMNPEPNQDLPHELDDDGKRRGRNRDV